MPQHKEQRRCAHPGCVGTQTYHAYSRPPGWGVGGGFDQPSRTVFQDRTLPAWECDAEPEHFDPVPN